MVRRNFHVAFLALTLNPRRDDHDNPADMDMLVSLLALAAIIAVTLAGVAAAPWLSHLFVVFWSYNVWALYVAPNL
jgi:hypothetical protein